MLLALWRYRQFVFSSIYNEYAVQFSRSRFGFLWLFVNPFVQVSIFVLVFSGVLAARLPHSNNKYSYVLYLLAGMVAWSLFTDVVSRCSTLFIDQGNLIKKMYFPRITLVGTVVGVSMVNNVAMLIITLALLFIVGAAPGLEILWVFPLYCVLLALALGVGLTLGVLNVFIRDIGLIVPIGLQLLFWATPVMYPIAIVPENIRWIVEANPMCAVVSGFHNVLVFNSAPDIVALLGSVVLAVGLLFLGLYLFRKASSEMADVL